MHLEVFQLRRGQDFLAPEASIVRQRPRRPSGPHAVDTLPHEQGSPGRPSAERPRGGAGSLMRSRALSWSDTVHAYIRVTGMKLFRWSVRIRCVGLLHALSHNGPSLQRFAHGLSARPAGPGRQLGGGMPSEGLGGGGIRVVGRGADVRERSPQTGEQRLSPIQIQPCVSI